MERLTFRLQLNKGFKKEYEKRHNPIWKELEDYFLNNGVIDYSIFIDDKSDELFGVIKIESKENWDKISISDVVSRWRLYMKDFYKTDSNGVPILSRMREVFYVER